MSESRLDAAVSILQLNIETAFEHGVDLKLRSIQLFGEVNTAMFARLDTALSILEAESKAGITIKINSEGGNPSDAIAIIGRFRRSRCQITTEGYGLIASAATMILASGDKRRMSAESMFMHHEGGLEVSGTVSQVNNLVKQTQREDDIWCATLARVSNQSKEFWLQKSKNSVDWYFSAQECLELGIVEEIF